VFIISCGEKEIDYASVLNTLRLGTWRVGYYTMNGTNETSRFNGYNFTFNMDSSVIVQKESNTITGLYEASNGNSNTQLNLYFGEDPLVDLNKDWKVLRLNGTLIEMENTTNQQQIPGNLHLQKN